MSDVLSREAILGRQLRTVEVEVPEWGGKLRLRELTGQQIEALDKLQDPKRYRALFVARCAVDEDGERLFQDEDVEQLLASPWLGLRRASDACMALHRYREGDLEAVEENFTDVPGDGSLSG